MFGGVGMADLTERYRSNPIQHHLTDSFVPFLNFKLKPPQKGGWVATQSPPPPRWIRPCNYILQSAQWAGKNGLWLRKKCKQCKLAASVLNSNQRCTSEAIKVTKDSPANNKGTARFVFLHPAKSVIERDNIAATRSGSSLVLPNVRHFLRIAKKNQKQQENLFAAFIKSFMKFETRSVVYYWF